MSRTNKPGPGGRGPGPPQQQPPGVRPPQSTAPAQFATTLGGYVMPHMAGAAAQQAGAGRPALIAMPGQPGAQVFINPAQLGQANIQALYAQQLQAMAMQQQAAQAQQAAQKPPVPQQPAPAMSAASAVRSASPANPQPVQQQPRPAAPAAPVPPANFSINLRMPTGEVKPYPIPQEFLKAHPNEWQAWVTNPNLHLEMWHRFSAWHTSRANAAAAAAARPAMPPAKRPKQEPAAVPRPGGAQVPTHMHPGIGGGAGTPGGLRPPSPALQQPQQPLTAAQQSAQAQAMLQQRIAAGAAGAAQRAGFPPITKPATEEDKHFLPKPRLTALVRESCGQGARLTGDAEAAFKSLAQDFVSNAVAFGVAMAKRRKGEVLEQADLQLYFERTWNLQVPGFNDAEVRPYRRPAASDIHRARVAAVRRSAAETSGAKAAAAEAATAANAAAAPPEAAAGGGGEGQEGRGATPGPAATPAAAARAPTPAATPASAAAAAPPAAAAGQAAQQAGRAGGGDAAGTGGGGGLGAGKAGGQAGVKAEEEDLDMPDFG